MDLITILRILTIVISLASLVINVVVLNNISKTEKNFKQLSRKQKKTINKIEDCYCVGRAYLIITPKLDLSELKEVDNA